MLGIFSFNNLILNKVKVIFLSKIILFTIFMFKKKNSKFNAYKNKDFIIHSQKKIFFIF